VKILLFGSNGQIGSHLQNSLVGLGGIKACTRKDCDLEDLQQVQKFIQEYKPTVIINAAAYTNVDKAESEPTKARAINANAVGLMADLAKNIDALLISYSSEYIFDGKKPTPYFEDDKANPLSVYGKTKFEGEEKIRNSGCKHLILRTSWIYSPSGSNFVNTIIKLAGEKDKLSVINDQIGAPTSAEFVANVTVQCLKSGINYQNMGTYHIASGESVSWYKFAKYILDYLKNKGATFRLDIDNITSVTSAEYNSLAKRPHNSVLDTQLIQKTFSIKIPSWKEQVEKTLSAIKISN
jgi:dTDP-4-dehydrorhamnose reductase